MARGVSELRRALIQLGAALDGDAGKLVAAVGRLDVPEALKLVTDAYPEMSSPYLAAAADLTATWYEDQPAPADAEGFVAEPAALPAVEQLAANARWSLTQDKPTTALLGAGRRQLFQQHRDTVLLNAEREGVRWVREARPGACGFCRMLATRVLTEGFGGAPGLYLSEETAGATPHTKDALGHDHCRCIAVPIRGGEPYTVPGYVHDWLEDYEHVSRGSDGRLLKPWRIAQLMEQRGTMRGEPVGEDVTGDHGARRPAVAELDTGRRAPAPARGPLALPAGRSAGQLAIEAPKRQLAINRKPAPIALPAARQPLMLTAAPSRPAVAPPDPRAIADWLDAEDDHRHALAYWRRVDAEDLHSLPPAEAIPDDEPAQLGPLAARVAELEAELAAAPPGKSKRKMQRRDRIRRQLKDARREQEEARAAGLPDVPVELATPDPDPVVDVQADDHAGETPLARAIREFEEALESGDDDAIDRAADAMERAEEAEKRDAERKAKAAARREAGREAEQDRIFALIEEGEDPQFAEAEVLSTNADGDRRVKKTLADGLYTDEETARKVVFNHILERIRRRDFMAQARADGHSGKGFDDLVDSVFERRVEEMYDDAEDATRGAMVKRPYVLKFNPKKLWYCNDATARKYMSEEMADWFDQNGRMTRPVFRQMILDGSTDFKSYTVMREDYLQ